MKLYVAGFLFDVKNDFVALIRKERPDWQKGKLNGIGGKVELAEEYDEAMVREFQEETGLETEAESWEQFCTLFFPDSLIVFFLHRNGNVWDTKLENTTDEQVNWYSINSIRSGAFTTIDNIPALLMLAQQFMAHTANKPSQRK